MALSVSGQAKGPALDSLDQDHEKVREKAGFGSDADNLKPVVGFVVHTDKTSFLQKGAWASKHTFHFASKEPKPLRKSG